MLADLGVALQLLGQCQATITYAGTEGVFMAPEVRVLKPLTTAVTSAAATGAATTPSQGNNDRKPYGNRCDIFSFGVMFLEIRFGLPAFYYIEDEQERLQRCRAEELDDELCEYWIMDSLFAGGSLTALEKSFVQSCIATDPEQRLSAEQLLEHPYLALASAMA